MRSSDSSGPSATSGSDTSDDEQTHPLDSYLAQRQAANAKDEIINKKLPLPPTLQLVSSSEESGELPPEEVVVEEEDFDDQLASGESEEEDTSSSSEGEEEEEVSSGSGEDSDDELTEDETQTKQQPQTLTYVPVGVAVLEEGQTAERNAEMIRLLRMRRYFDDDFEENAKRCFKCGAAGHMARDCTNPPRLRSCYLCAEFGHDGRDCPNQLCWKCQKTGHQSRDCPMLVVGSRRQHNEQLNSKNKKRVRAWDEEDNPTVCLKCGRSDCPCAGYGDYARAEGRCTNPYKVKDMEKVRCYVCGHRGHLACTPGNGSIELLLQLPPSKLTCYNCGEGGHAGEKCKKEKPISMRSERQRDRGTPNTAQYNRGDPSTGGRGGGSSQYNSGGRYLDSGNYDRYERYQPEERQQQRHSYGGGGGFQRGGNEYSQERRGRYSDYNADSRKRMRYNDDYEDRSYGAQHSGGGGGGDSYKGKGHANAYGALHNTEFDGGFYETPPYHQQRKKPREKSRFSSGGGGSRGGGGMSGGSSGGKRGGGSGNNSNKRRR